MEKMWIVDEIKKQRLQNEELVDSYTTCSAAARTWGSLPSELTSS